MSWRSASARSGRCSRTLSATRTAEPNRLDLRFADGSSRRVEALAEAERRCCAFLTFRTTATGLTIEAPAGAEDTLDGFAALADETLRR